MREHSADGAAGALHVHEVRVGRRDKALLLVGVLLSERGRVQKVLLDDRLLDREEDTTIGYEGGSSTRETR